ncbi:hypothetical protein [Castellaniella caeni]|uniref:hypothetical protein n=1 Tax=Castellaniella caeni TaxID=266123 RepID=UPI000C9F8D33|nr:hypothetical protein [Castellaniella caeni]
MIPITQAKEPVNFDANVRQPGLRAIAEMVGKPSPYPRTKGTPYRQIVSREADIPPAEFPSYWTAALVDLMRAYDETCAYSCFKIHPVTGGGSVDHLAPKSRNWRDIYEWSNYRLCCSRMNARKRDFGDVLDPFEIGAGWFELELVGFQVMPGRDVRNTPVEQQVHDTIARLRLNDFSRERAQDAEYYWSKDYSLRVLKKEALSRSVWKRCPSTSMLQCSGVGV